MCAITKEETDCKFINTNEKFTHFYKVKYFHTISLKIYTFFYLKVKISINNTSIYIEQKFIVLIITSQIWLQLHLNQNCSAGIPENLGNYCLRKMKYTTLEII